MAVDVALTARRLGAAEVHMVCLEKRDEMPASTWEIEQAVEEGVQHPCLVGAERHTPDTGVKVVGLDAQRVHEVFDEKGMFNPTFNECILRRFRCGYGDPRHRPGARDRLCEGVPDLNAGRTGWIMADALTLATPSPAYSRAAIS